MNLIVGATGMLGGEICRLLARQSSAVRALVRDTSNAESVAALRGLGADVVQGDLKDAASLRAACRGVRAVVSTASSTVSRREGDSIDTVDRDGQLDLVEAAEAAGVEHFVFVSFPTVGIDFPLQAAKRAVEDRLRRSRMTYTIFQPTFFMEVWLTAPLGFDAASATARIYGLGGNRISWISARDVARFAIVALNQPQAASAVIRLGGPDALSPLEVVRIAEEVSGRKWVVEHVPEAALRAQYEAATDPLQRSFAALMLYYAHGDVIAVADTIRMLPGQRLTAVREYLQTAIAPPVRRPA